MRFFSPRLEWIMLAMISATLATCCVGTYTPEDVAEKKPFVLEE
jgi:hypothetical protein